MPTIKAQAIFDDLVTQLKTITTGNGYVTAIGTKVDEWRDDYADIVNSELPRLNVRDPETVTEEETLPDGERHTLKVIIEGFCASGSWSATADSLRSLEADIRKALVKANAWETWGNGRVEVARVVRTERGVAMAQKIVGQVNVEIDLEYLTYQFDPYTT